MMMKAQQFPGSIRIGARVAVWLESDVDAWIEARVDTTRGAVVPLVGK
jgi:predicted DNA-binding transcriptional regulator AlpA